MSDPVAAPGRIRVRVKDGTILVADGSGHALSQHCIPLRAVSDVAMVMRRSAWRWVWWVTFPLGLLFLAAGTVLSGYAFNYTELPPLYALFLLSSGLDVWLGLLLGIAGLFGLLGTGQRQAIAVRGAAGSVLWGAGLAEVRGATATYLVLVQALRAHEAGRAREKDE